MHSPERSADRGDKLSPDTDDRPGRGVHQLGGWHVTPVPPRRDTETDRMWSALSSISRSTDRPHRQRRGLCTEGELTSPMARSSYVRIAYTCSATHVCTLRLTEGRARVPSGRTEARRMPAEPCPRHHRRHPGSSGADGSRTTRLPAARPTLPACRLAALGRSRLLPTLLPVFLHPLGRGLPCFLRHVAPLPRRLRWLCRRPRASRLSTKRGNRRIDFGDTVQQLGPFGLEQCYDILHCHSHFRQSAMNSDEWNSIPSFHGDRRPAGRRQVPGAPCTVRATQPGQVRPGPPPAASRPRATPLPRPLEVARRRTLDTSQSLWLFWSPPLTLDKVLKKSGLTLPVKMFASHGARHFGSDCTGRSPLLLHERRSFTGSP